MLEIRLLGGFDVRLDGTNITIPSRPAQSLFAYLILNPKTAHRREKLAGLLWPDSADVSARDYLRHALWRIRKSFPAKAKVDILIADDLTIAFDTTQNYWLDIDAMEQASESTSADELLSALDAYRGELLPGLYDDWVILEREHLQSVYEHNMARLMALLEGEARWLEIIDWGERWISFGQKPEPAYRALMRAHAALGEMSLVAATFARCAKSLREYGLEPSEQTARLFNDLKSGRDLPKELVSSVKRPAKEILSNIPVPLTSFVGRQKDLKEIARLLSSSRLLTLTGPGGVGKTRLAIQTAHDSVSKFKNGVYWVSLVGLSDPNLIPQEIALSLDMRESSNKPLLETLKTQLKAKDLLIVLDNCEHLIKACAQYAEQLLASCLKLKILATSIEGLGLFNETIWQVPSLPLPERQQDISLKELREYASIALFDERAGNAKSGFALNEKNAKFITQICERLDGIPLAIELAAARIKVLSVDEIASRLDDRFSLLTAGSRTAIPRHQTLRATIDWSHDLLTEPERTLFRRLSVFVSGFTLEAAESVCSHDLTASDILDLLGRLVDKSLVIVDAGSETGESRYRMLETIRQYALEKLLAMGEAPTIRNRHLGFYLDLAEISEPLIFSRQSAVWFDRLDKELDNLRAAMEWSTNNGKAVAALRIAGSLVYFWFARGLPASEWHERIQQALSRPEGMKRTLARAKALNGIGFMYWADIYPIDKRPELEEALSIAQEMNDRWNTAMAIRNLGLLANIQGNYPEASLFLEKSLELWRELGSESKWVEASTLTFLGDVALNQNKAETARTRYEESIAILRAAGDRNFLAYTIRRLGQLAWRAGEYKKAIALCRKSLDLNQEVSDPRGVVACLAGFAAIAAAQGDYKRAAVLMGAVEAQLDSIGIRLLYIDKLEFDRNLTQLHNQFDEKSLARLWAKGRKMNGQEAIRSALE